MIGNRKDFIDLLMAALVTVLVSSAVGQTTQPTTSQPSEKGGESQGALQGTIEKAAVSDHEVTIDGRVVKYKATAANMPMKDETGKVKATVFFVAYERVEKNEALTQPTETATRPARPDLRDRPITFVFNGGPGAAAACIWKATR